MSLGMKWKRGDKRPDTRVKFSGVGRVRRADGPAADINAIVNRFTKHGQAPNVPGDQVFADVSDMGDFGAAMNKVVAGRRVFDALHPSIRAAFENRAELFLQFAADPKNRKEYLTMRYGQQFADRWAREEALKASRKKRHEAAEDLELVPPSDEAIKASPKAPEVPSKPA